MIHWLSDQLLAQRVESLPSIALAGVYDVSNWVLDADADFPYARLAMASPRCAGNCTTCW